MTAPLAIRRAFADVAHGQMHYRTSGSGDPTVLLHASPGSSKQLVGLIEDLSSEMLVYSPDTPGNGDSPALALEAPAITDLAKAALNYLETMGLERIRLYGSHTGAAIAAEVAILAPERVSRLVLDGVQLLTTDERADVMARYAFPFTPDLDGAYLLRTFQFCRDQYMFYPWYDRTREGQRTGGLPTPQALHNWVIEVLKASETYHLNYRAAFQWQPLDRLPLVKVPTLVVAAENDPLYDNTVTVTAALPDGRFLELPRLDAPDYRAQRKAALTAFFAAKA